MKTIKIDSAWHIGQVATFLYDHVDKTKEPCTVHFNDVRIIMFPEDYNFKDHVDVPLWEDRPEVESM